MDRITLAQRRKRLGLSRADLARLLVVSESTVWRWEEGKTTPSRIVSAFIDQVLSARESEARPAAEVERVLRGGEGVMGEKMPGSIADLTGTLTFDMEAMPPDEQERLRNLYALAFPDTSPHSRAAQPATEGE